MADEPEKTPIQSKYAQQYADDLAANRKEQGGITTQLAGLQERLEQLKVEEDWLVQAQGGLPASAAGREPEAEPAATMSPASSAGNAERSKSSAPAKAGADAPSTVPQPRQDQSVKAEQPKQAAKKTPAKKTTAKKTATTKNAAAKTATAKKTTAKKAVTKKAVPGRATAPETAAVEGSAEKAAAEEKSGPPLWQLILDILLKTPGEPCVAREVTDQLAQDHPSRKTSVQTVRNNLEALVKKELAEKALRQGNAMYTATVDGGAGTATAAGAPAGGEGEQAPETAAEKVPAEV
ncbi:hypothetical protein ACPXCO_37345 [Streptomyces cyaneofuscatus]|uniref:hypothetical protein n=1 Tax=Streptomyces cyaneofuscatus TaxID=66883 RepID=UPI003CF68B31